jgi:hypothetical protein
MKKRPKKQFDHSLSPRLIETDDPSVQPDWSNSCHACGALPTVPLTGLCGPCTFGEAETSGGNWL